MKDYAEKHPLKKSFLAMGGLGQRRRQESWPGNTGSGDFRSTGYYCPCQPSPSLAEYNGFGFFTALIRNMFLPKVIGAP